MKKNAYLILVYGIYSIIMFSLSLRMQKNIFKYITPISKRLNLSKFRRIKIFRRRSQRKRVNVFNDVVNKYIGLDLFFRKLNDVTDTRQKLNYINFLHKIVEDKTCEHLLFSNNHIRTIIYILNERFLIIKKNEDKNEPVDYQIIYKLLLIFNNLSKHKNFYRIIVNDFTHKNVKISLLYIIMNILNEKEETGETYKEANSFFSYFISLFKNNSDGTKSQHVEDLPEGGETQEAREKNQMKKEDIEEMKNKIVSLGKHILLKLKEEKLKEEGKSIKYNLTNNGEILTNVPYVEGDFPAQNVDYTSEKNRKEYANNVYDGVNSQFVQDGTMRGEIPTEDNKEEEILDHTKEDNQMGSSKKDSWAGNISGHGDPHKGQNSFTQSNRWDVEGQEIKSAQTVGVSTDNVLFVPFYFNKNAKDNILTSVLVQFQNENDVIVYKRKARKGNQDQGSEQLSLEKLRKKNILSNPNSLNNVSNIIQWIGEEYNCNNYFDVYENYAEDDVDILKYEKNQSGKRFHIREGRGDRDAGGEDKTNVVDDVHEEGREVEDEMEGEEEIHEEEEQQEEVQEDEEIENQEEYEEDLQNDKQEEKEEDEINSDQKKVNVILTDYNVDIKDVENNPDLKVNGGTENKSRFLNMGLLILIRKNENGKEDRWASLNMRGDTVGTEIYGAPGMVSSGPSMNTDNIAADTPYKGSIPREQICTEGEPRRGVESVEGYEEIYVKRKEGEDAPKPEKYVLTGFIQLNMDLLKNFKVSSEDKDGRETNPMHINNPYLNFSLVENYIESLFKHIDLNDYFTNKLLKLLYEILSENKNSLVYNLYYYTIMKKDNMNKIIKILSKNVQNNLNRANITLILRILYILSFHQAFYRNGLNSLKRNKNYTLLYGNVAKYIEDIKTGSFIKELQKWDKLIECLKTLTLFFESKYTNQNSLYISDEKKEQFLLDNKILKKKLNNIYNRHFICEYKDLVIIRKTNILLKALGVNMFDLYNDIVFLDREKKPHDYLMKESEQRRGLFHHLWNSLWGYFAKARRYMGRQAVEEFPFVEDSKRVGPIGETSGEGVRGNVPIDRVSNRGSAFPSEAQTHGEGAHTQNGSNPAKDTQEQRNRKKRTYIYDLNNKEHISMDKFRNLVIALKKKKKRKLRILCLDGGGIRGLLSIEILKCINSHLKKNIFEYFDIICGTSTGAIISILIGLEKAHLNEVEFLYNLLINKIFQKDTYAVRNTRYLFKHSYYDANILSNILNSFFKNMKMFHYNADFFTPYVFTVSTQMNVTPLQPVILKNYTANLGKIKGDKEEADVCDTHTSSNYDHVGEREEQNEVEVGDERWALGQHNQIWDDQQNDTKDGKDAIDAQDEKGVNISDKVNLHTNDIYVNQNINSVSIYKSFYNIFVKYVLRCTTAAPGFFNFFSFDSNIYADGAICFNNPTLVSLNEMKLIFYNYLNSRKETLLDKVKCFFSKKKELVEEKNKAINLNDYIDCIVSVGTGKFKPKNINELNENKTSDTFLRWDVLLKQIVYSITNTELTHDICNNVLDKNKYFRFNCFINNIKLDETSPEIISKLKQIGKRYFEDHAYNQKKLIQLVDILEDKRDVKEYQQRQRKIWGESYLDKMKSKISGLLFPNGGSMGGQVGSTDQKEGQVAPSSHHVNTEKTGKQMNTQPNEQSNTRSSAPYRNFNFGFVEEDEKFDLNNIEEILDIINKSNNSGSSTTTNTSNGFFHYFTNLFQNNNKFLKKLESVHKNNFFTRSNREKNNYVNVVPLTGIRVLLNEIYFILLKKNLYFHTDECFSNVEELNKKNYDINIDKMIPYNVANSQGGKEKIDHPNVPRDKTQEQDGSIPSDDSPTNEEVTKNEKHSNDTQRRKKSVNNSKEFTSDEDLDEDNHPYKPKGPSSGPNSKKINDSNNSAFNGKHTSYEDEESYDLSDGTQKDDPLRETLLRDEKMNTSDMVDNSSINKKRLFKKDVNMNHINYKFFKSMSTETTDGKKQNIINILRNVFFKREA
ncbi:patatin-like phospholipase, putative [Plasmodium knowlesi strain H]|uniref:Patatin-like phospholipase, putative n=3 Tax=Plasmodium knowlesi TaxID=5850 RepID=A0A5K1UUS6_PLAKH|nr:patatin-like phospholipase, putative [Plasmodium knowlesi strain H]OTN64464.1 putative Patatin-like phospholipase [Plasmodium knowlesi]CAA9988964.1 patatin-like phospholipase, putative [Plasmodium knowlesi strain H]SBO24808.1 patatin-like phospholipase, putative [Plasmodium knowlesi strain H]SBO28071.1 patatin-like phospholipase, putative [Plasmodium knowlesi strain H]VVS78438.1 patatin-like phospholipase, putative [Plasmodium knowlesi strain H]|eukprot:XP_002261312.1 patatin-like phospholipase, putative [Plasmodium knowlesi strain H]